MRTLIKFCWGVLLLLCPTAILAQTTPRLYVGTSAGLTRFYPFESYASWSVGPAVTVGVQLSPRWAVETGAQLTWARNSYYHTDSTTSGTIDFASSSSRVTTLLLPLWARFTVTAAASRLHVDVLGGIGWVHGTSSGNYSFSRNGYIYHSDYSETVNEFSVGLGPQVRYSLGRHFDVKFSAPISLRVNHNDFLPEFTQRLFLNPQLGVQYSFGG